MKMQKYVLNNIMYKKLGDRYLITTDHGDWADVTRKEFSSLLCRKPDSRLLRRAENKGIVVTKSNIKKIIEKFKRKNSFLFQGTSLHIVVPALRCNMQCVYCHASSRQIDAKGFDMDKDTARKTVDFIFCSPSPQIVIEFQGGEPLLNFDIVKFIVGYAGELNKKHRKDLIFRFVTNLTMMDYKKLDFLIKQDVGICTSLDGHKLVHNKNRGKYDEVALWIDRINKEYRKRGKKKKVNALITVTKTSLKYPEEIIDEYRKLGFDNIHLRPLTNLGLASDRWEEIGYSAEEFVHFWTNAIDYMIENNIQMKPRSVLIILQKILTEKDPNYLDLRSPCGAVIGQIVYDHNGDIFTCDEGRMLGEDIFKLGNVKNNSYKEILSSEQTCAVVSASVNDGYACNSCAYKPYCGLCPVCNYADQGSIIAKVPSTRRCKIFKAQFDYVFNKFINDKKAREMFLKWIKR